MRIKWAKTLCEQCFSSICPINNATGWIPLQHRQDISQLGHAPIIPRGRIIRWDIRCANSSFLFSIKFSHKSISHTLPRRFSQFPILRSHSRRSSLGMGALDLLRPLKSCRRSDFTPLRLFDTNIRTAHDHRDLSSIDQL